MSIFEKKEKGGSEEEFNPKWEKVDWDGWTDVWARPFNEAEDSWEISVELPENTDPESVKIVYVVYENENGYFQFYNVQFRQKDKNIFKFWEFPYQTQEGNTVAEFGVHIGGDFEKSLGMQEIKFPSSSDEPKEL